MEYFLFVFFAFSGNEITGGANAKYLYFYKSCIGIGFSLQLLQTLCNVNRILRFIYSCTIRQNDISGLQALLTRYEVFICVFIPHSYQRSIWMTIDIIIIHVFIKHVGVFQLHSYILQTMKLLLQSVKGNTNWRKGIQTPVGLALDPWHSWTRREDNGSVRIHVRLWCTRHFSWHWIRSVGPLDRMQCQWNCYVLLMSLTE